ncbi:unnamed protein product [Gongylonema pulchrum]|uniref:Single-stranded DNA-binding protein n=1 Tax=Gongylonema pulchrum TaxID=637853 RepID=A0A183ED08_9BILA|nr:unnamed protein product [Gongylonema pulchrum]
MLCTHSENHIEVTGIVRGPPRVYTMPTGRQYAIVKLSTTSGMLSITSSTSHFALMLENHIEVTGIVRGPPRVYTMPTGRQYAIVKLSTTSADRRGITRFVSFVDVFTPNSAVDYIKENIREGVQVYVSGQLRSRMRTDEDGRPFQDIRIQANGLFKIVAPRNLPEESNIAVEKRDSVTSESKQQDASQETSAKTASSE